MLYLIFMDKSGKKIGKAFETPFQRNNERQTIFVS